MILNILIGYHIIYYICILMILCDIDPYPFIKKMHWESYTHLTSLVCLIWRLTFWIVTWYITWLSRSLRERERLNLWILLLLYSYPEILLKCHLVYLYVIICGYMTETETDHLFLIQNPEQTSTWHIIIITRERHMPMNSIKIIEV